MGLVGHFHFYLLVGSDKGPILLARQGGGHEQSRGSWDTACSLTHGAVQAQGQEGSR